MKCQESPRLKAGEYFNYQLGDNPNDWVKIYYSVPLGTGKKCEFRVEESHDDIVAGVEGFNPDAWILNIMLKVVDAR